MPDARQIDGLRQVAGEISAVLVDQFGVMHDGTRPYDGAVEALQNLMRDGKKVVVLTNSGKRAARNVERVRSVGFPADSFSGLVSSGEVAWAGIRSGQFGPAFVPGARAGLVGKQGSDYGLDDLGLHFVKDFADADILLIMGSNCPRTSLEDYCRLLEPAARRGIVALCCNPDLAMLTSHGLQPSAGAIAKLYAELSGPVIFVGKPHAAIYREAAKLAGAQGRQILAIGDSLDHDIAGGAAAGFRTALVRTGVLAHLGDIEFEAELDAKRYKPDYILPRLVW